MREADELSKIVMKEELLIVIKTKVASLKKEIEFLEMIIEILAK